jgi:hypothetical protein
MFHIPQKYSFKSLNFLGVLTIGSIAITGCSFSLSSATLENLKTCSEQVANKECANNVASFTKTTPKLFATADLKHAPEGTKVKINWKYLGGEAGDAKTIDSVSIVTDSNMDLITSNLEFSGKEWPTGNYEVAFMLETDNSKPLKKQFSITK